MTVGREVRFVARLRIWHVMVSYDNVCYTIQGFAMVFTNVA